MNFNLAVVAGDGIGPEVMEQNINVLNAIGKKFGHTFNYVSQFSRRAKVYCIH